MVTNAKNLQKLIVRQETLLKAKQPGPIYRQRADYLAYLRERYAEQVQREQLHRDWRPNNDH